MKIMVTGGRHYNDEDHIRKTFEQFIREHGVPDELIVGDATGADSLARVIAMELGIPVTVFYANWVKYKKAAGPVRNEEMVKQRPDFCLPFPGNRGTANAIALCKRRGVRLFYAKSD